MGIPGIKKPYNEQNTLRKKLAVIEALIFLIPSLSILYIFFQRNTAINMSQLLITLAVLCIVLGGMLLLRQIFDRIFMVQNLIQSAERGEQYAMDVRKDTDELHGITKSFNNLMNNFQKSNQELQRSIEEIAERKKIAVALKQAKEQAEAANMAKSRFIANMTHEFLSPLNAVIGFSQLLGTKAHGELNEQQIKYTQNVMDSGQKLLKLVNGVLELAKIETEQMEMDFSVFNITDELNATMNLVLESADKKDIALTSDLQADIQPINADRDKFKQIVLNILNNAVKFTPIGGSIVLSAKNLMVSELLARTSGEPDTAIQLFDKEIKLLQISISDTGIGIKSEDQDRIFSIFEQADMSAERPFDGTGIGLAVSHKLVNLHKGKIWVSSEGKDKGSRFTFVLPLNPYSVFQNSSAGCSQPV
jgi:signal transduction histidine kinase